jgi:hypothetical protein
MTESGRYLGSATRVSIVLFYGAIAFLIANHLGQTNPDRSDIMPASANQSTGEEIRLKLNLEASRPIERWSVTADGVTVKNGTITPHGWSAEIDLEPLPDQRLIIDVQPSESPSESPLAVHLTISFSGKTWEQTFWAPDDLVESVFLGPLWKDWEVAP